MTGFFIILLLSLYYAYCEIFLVDKVVIEAGVKDRSIIHGKQWPLRVFGWFSVTLASFSGLALEVYPLALNAFFTAVVLWIFIDMLSALWLKKPWYYVGVTAETDELFTEKLAKIKWLSNIKDIAAKLNWTAKVLLFLICIILKL